MISELASRRSLASSVAFVIVMASASTSFGQLENEDATLRIVARDSHLPGVPLLVRLEIRLPDGAFHRDAWNCEARLSAAGVSLEPDRVPIYNGLGSALVRVTGSGDFTLRADACGLEAEKDIRSLAGEEIAEVSGPLPVADLEWSGIIHVTADTLVPEGATLRVLPGTLVLLAGVADGSSGADLNIEGVIHSQGTLERPVTFTAFDPDLAWGELHHNEPIDASSYRYTMITRAGNSPGGGHTGTGPAMRPEEATIRLESCTISDNEGKVMQADGSDLEFQDCHFARSVMGPEIDGTALLMENSSITEMFGEDDNDGIYVHSQREGQRVHIVRSVVADGDDDAIDTLGSEVLITSSIVRDFADKGVSVFHDTVQIDRCLILDNDIGVSAKTDDDRTLRVRIDRSTIVGNRLGIQARDKNGEPDAIILYDVTSSIVHGTELSVATDYDPADITITHSALGAPEAPWADAAGNIDDEPLFVDGAGYDFHLQETSPCIDTGAPTSPLDPDGTRADMGALPFLGGRGEPRFRRGESNGDGNIDLADAVTVLLHLFGGRPMVCEDAGDVDDDGRVAINDAAFLLSFLFQAGAAPPAPFATCGEDSTDDEVGCARTSCL